jgi:hypothetical protein
MERLSVAIMRFVDDYQPGVVMCQFADAEDRLHTFIDKAPMFSSELLDAASVYPQSGITRCEVLTRWRDQRGRELVRISTARPDAIESTEGLSEFVVLSTQVSAI